MPADAPILVIDYHKGNLQSVERGLVAAGGRAFVSDDPNRMAMASGLVLPGVGSFEDAMDFMRASGQDEAVVEAIRSGVPFLGICLGLHLLFERGDERTRSSEPEGMWAQGLSVLTGSVRRLASSRLKVPHVGWDQIDLTEHDEDSFARLLPEVDIVICWGVWTWVPDAAREPHRSVRNGIFLFHAGSIRSYLRRGIDG